MTDILDLEGWHVLSKARSDDEYEIEAEYTVQPEACQKCGVIGGLYRHGPKVVSYRDSPIYGHPSRILARVQRYKCRECNGTFLQPLSGIQAAMRMTQRCVEYIEGQSLRDTFLRIAEHIGCDDKTVRNIAGQYIARLNADYEPYLPAWLGIDETQIDGKMRCIITDVGNNQPIDMLLAKSDGRCMSCQGVFSAKELFVSTMRPIVEGEPVQNAALLCLPCKQRFHTERASRHDSGSTR